MSENLINPKSMSIYEKLLEARKTVPYLKKDKKGYDYKYVSGSQVIGNLRGKLDELGLLLKPEVIKVTHVEIKLPKKAPKEAENPENLGEKIENLVTAEILFTWINVDKPDEKIECRWFGMGQNAREKGIGSALTYAERYFLLKFFMIPTDEMDPDSYQEKYYDEPAKQPSTQSPTNNQPPKKVFTINNKIHDDLLPAELQGKEITFMDLGKTPDLYKFKTKANGIQNGKYLLQFWGNTAWHTYHDVANMVLDAVSQAPDEFQPPDESQAPDKSQPPQQ